MTCHRISIAHLPVPVAVTQLEETGVRGTGDGVAGYSLKYCGGHVRRARKNVDLARRPCNQRGEVGWGRGSDTAGTDRDAMGLMYGSGVVRLRR